MRSFRKIRRGFRQFFARNAVELEMEEEMRIHLEMEMAANLRKGMDPREARRQALIAFGGMDRFKERAREQRPFGWIDDLVRDLRFGARQLGKSPVLTLGVLLTLGLGIGANTAVFSVVREVLLEPFPYPESSRLAVVLSQGPDGGTGPTSGPDFLEWRGSASTFEALSAYASGPLNLTGQGEPERLVGASVTEEMFQVFGVRPALGSGLLPGDDNSRDPRRVVLSHAFWERSFGGDVGALGTTITLNGQPYTVVGVMPSGFNLPVPWARYDLWMPLVPSDLREQRDWRHLRVVGRIREGASVEAAQSELEAIAHSLAVRYPETNRGTTVQVLPLKTAYLGDLRGPLLILTLAALAILLIVSANLAGMLLARVLSRRGEMAMRAALGAGRGRLVRQTLSETSLLVLLGGAFGILVAAASLGLLRPLLATVLPRVGEIGIDVWVLGFTAVVCLGVTLALGLAPAMLDWVGDPDEVLKERGAGGIPSVGRTRLRSAFLAAQFALTLVLANGAALLLQSYLALRNVPPGFSLQGLLTFSVTPEGGRYEDPQERVAFYWSVLGSIAAVPGVEGVGASSKLPFEGGSNTKVMVAGKEGEFLPEEAPLIELSRVMPGYLETMGIPLLSGRHLQPRDFEDGAPGILINEAMARRLFPSGDPVGQRVSWEIAAPRWLTVVGVVGDVRQWGLENPAQPEMYVPYSVLPRPRMYLVVRSSSDPAALIRAIQGAVFSADSSIPVADVRTMEEVLSGFTAGPQLNAFLVIFLAGIALVLIATGIYGVVSYSAARRTHEIGIRMVLGASRLATLRFVLHRGLTPAVTGLALGIGTFLAVARLLRTLLFEVEPYDPATLTWSVALVLCLGIVGSLLPAVRASRINIVEAIGIR